MWEQKKSSKNFEYPWLTHTESYDMKRRNMESKFHLASVIRLSLSLARLHSMNHGKSFSLLHSMKFHFRVFSSSPFYRLLFWHFFCVCLHHINISDWNNEKEILRPSSASPYHQTNIVKHDKSSSCSFLLYRDSGGNENVVNFYFRTTLPSMCCRSVGEPKKSRNLSKLILKQISFRLSALQMRFGVSIWTKESDIKRMWRKVF